MVPFSGRKVLAAIAAGTLLGTTALVSPALASPNNNSAKKLTKAVTVKGVLKHLDTFQAIADANADTRASGTPGYDASADYVAKLLKKAGYQVTRQQFDFAFYEEFGSSFAQVAPSPTTYTDGVDYELMDYSGAGMAEATVVPVDLALDPPRASSSGCEASDFDAVDVAGKVALMQRGTCAFGDKVVNAEAAGAVGAIIMNQGNGTPEANADRYDLFAGTLGTPVGIPAVSVSYYSGEQFAATAGLAVRIEADTTSEIRSTENVFAQTRHGRTDNVVMAGAHLDSDPAGPGYNDNGTGSAALLEVALQMAKVKPKNAVRFAWWGAEEAGLVGSQYYVDSLTEQQIADIALYLNFDMVGSPNYVFGVYDGDDSAEQGSGPGPEGSAEIEKVFEKFFASRKLPTVPSDFTGRSDYGAFIAAGVDIPAGGLFTGAEGVKTEAEVALFGGLAGVSYDPCYHQACDSRTPVADGADAAIYQALSKKYRLQGNVNVFALDVNADAIATAVITFAYDTSKVNGVTTPGKGKGKHGHKHGHGHHWR
ncbi:M28 family peptidase [Micromonospora sediminimaris]|uniref:Amidohydrolase n=1 Tax=Micromonospora sediminimaris TaxID=547162 RepID=A0A9W5XJD2_9ACTN|nr:amidohydrolase [Micromonospora sediminimaris]SFC06851.1 Zn-dependent amino-or carboxypeptidase, M28 family [Micromonospora sediminimaris]